MSQTAALWGLSLFQSLPPGARTTPHALNHTLVYTFVILYIYVYIYLFIYIYIYICSLCYVMHMYTRLRACHIHASRYMPIHVYTILNLNIYTCTYIHYIYIHIYTYIIFHLFVQRFSVIKLVFILISDFPETVSFL